jgi:hypothetical protein
MYETRYSRYVPKAGADGCFHQRLPLGEKPRSDRRKNKGFTAAEAGWEECCEYCPYPDCVHKSLGVCLTVITYGELEAFVDSVVDRMENGTSILLISKEVRISFNTLKMILDFRCYPTKPAQRRIKQYLNKHKEDLGK